MTFDEVVRAYCKSWNEKDEDARRALLESCWSESGQYTDPMGAAPPGREGLVAHISGFHAGYPGAKIVPTSRADLHHGKIHFTWQLVLADGTVAIDGRDFGELDEKGKIKTIVGFFTPPPAL